MVISNGEYQGFRRTTMNIRPAMTAGQRELIVLNSFGEVGRNGTTTERRFQPKLGSSNLPSLVLAHQELRCQELVGEALTLYQKDWRIPLLLRAGIR